MTPDVLFQLYLVAISTLGVAMVAHADKLEYTTTIVSDPPSGPFRLGSSVTFSCLVDPAPPSPVTYQWRIINSYNERVSNGQNITFNPYYLDLQFTWVFCHVMSNGTRVSVGSRQVELQGLFNDQSDLVHHFTAGDFLTVRINPSPRIDNIVRDFAWYHNGSELLTSGRFTVTNGDTVLNITDLRSSDAGIYQVKPSRIHSFFPMRDSCNLLSLFGSHSGFAPVTFIVRESCQCQVEPYDSSLVFPVTNTSYFSGEARETHSLNIELHFELELEPFGLNDHNVNWFHNGVPLNTNGVKYSSSITVTGQVVFMSLSINNITDNDAGLYSAILYFPCLVCIREVWREICGYYVRFNRLRVNDAIFGATTMDVKKYEPPGVEFFQTQSLTKGSSLECSAVGGNPQLYNHNIMLTKNNVTIAATLGGQISYNLSDAFGEYTCIVESLLSNTSKTVIFSQKVNIQILVESVTDGVCVQQQIEDGQDVNSIIVSILAVIEDQCNCSVSMDNFEGSSLSCLSYGPNAIFTSTLVYSDSEGEVLASDLVAMFQSQLEASDGQTLEGTSFVIPSRRQSTSGGVIAGVFVGGWIVGLLTLALAIGIGVCICKSKANTNVPAKGQGGNASSERQTYVVKEDMAMGSIEVQPNTAYKTISRQQDQNTVDIYETLYENPM